MILEGNIVKYEGQEHFVYGFKPNEKSRTLEVEEFINEKIASQYQDIAEETSMDPYYLMGLHQGFNFFYNSHKRRPIATHHPLVNISSGLDTCIESWRKGLVRASLFTKKFLITNVQNRAQFLKGVKHSLYYEVAIQVFTCSSDYDNYQSKIEKVFSSPPKEKVAKLIEALSMSELSRDYHKMIRIKIGPDTVPVGIAKSYKSTLSGCFLDYNFEEYIKGTPESLREYTLETRTFLARDAEPEKVHRWKVIVGEHKINLKFVDSESIITHNPTPSSLSIGKVKVIRFIQRNSRSGRIEHGSKAALYESTKRTLGDPGVASDVEIVNLETWKKTTMPLEVAEEELEFVCSGYEWEFLTPHQKQMRGQEI